MYPLHRNGRIASVRAIVC